MDNESDEQENVFGGASIFGDDVAEDEVAPGRSIFASDPEPVDDASELPPWSSEPAAAGEPVGTAADDLEAWSTLTDGTPRWGDDPVEPEPTTVTVGGSEDFFSFDDTAHDPIEDFHQRAGQNEPPRIGGPSLDDPMAPVGGGGGGRNMNQAIMTGVGLAVIAIACLWAGPVPALIFVTVLLAFATAEFYVAVRRAGYQPAALLGIAATVCLSLAVYWRFEAAVPLVLFLTVVFSMLWFLTGVDSEAPVLNIGVTLLGVLYVGFLGSFAGLMLADGFDHGVGLLLSAILVTIAYDVGGLVVGTAMGRSPLSAASPNKTVEGLIGGMIAAVLMAVVVVGLLANIAPFGDTPGGDLLDVLVLGVAAAVAAPLGDLCESLLKRDLGIKDMGTILPGHGGLLDRFDALLFVLPATYFAARLLDLYGG